ncbi:MAG TPA: hypothetical protein VN781_04930 [Acidimicrobiales bacterium]|nr:hypothetical protein [Acidimicrobiales bacterium]
MSVTRLALVLGALVLAGLCVLAGIGFTAAIPVLVTVAVLVVLVGGGNLIAGRSSPPAAHRVGDPGDQSEPGPRSPADRPAAGGAA